MRSCLSPSPSSVLRPSTLPLPESLPVPSSACVLAPSSSHFAPPSSFIPPLSCDPSLGSPGIFLGLPVPGFREFSRLVGFVHIPYIAGFTYHCIAMRYYVSLLLNRLCIALRSVEMRRNAVPLHRLHLTHWCVLFRIEMCGCVLVGDSSLLCPHFSHSFNSCSSRTWVTTPVQL